MITINVIATITINIIAIITIGPRAEAAEAEAAGPKDVDVHLRQVCLRWIINYMMICIYIYIYIHI